MDVGWYGSTELMSLLRKCGLIMNSVTKQIHNMEDSLFNIEAALDIAVSQKDQTELLRKKAKLTKKLNKLQRRINNSNISNTSSRDNDKGWR